MSKDFLLLSAVYVLFALPLAFMDARRFRISLPVLCAGIAALVAFRLGYFPISARAVQNMCFAAGSAFLIYFCVRVLSGEGLGWQAVLFGVFSALYTGFYMNIIAAVFAALLGVLYYLASAAFRKLRKVGFVHRPIFAIPFVPFITAGSVLSMLLFVVIA